MAPKPKEVSVELLEERIRRDGVVKAGGVLKVDAFLNHQMDIELFSPRWPRNGSGCSRTSPSTRSSPSRPRASASPPWWRTISGIARGVREEDPVHQLGRHHVFHAHPVLHPQPHLRRHRLHALPRADDHVLIIDDFLANGAPARAAPDLRAPGPPWRASALPSRLPARWRRAARGGLRSAIPRHRQAMDPTTGAIEFRS